MSRYVRFADTNNHLQRLVVPDDCSVEIEQKSESITQTYNGTQYPQIVTVFCLVVRRGDQILARLNNIACFRDEEIGVETCTSSPSGIEWAPE